MHAFDRPMTTGAAGHALDVERRGADEVTRVEGASVGMLGAGMDLEEALDVGETGLARVAPIGHDPVDLARGHICARLDAAMAFLDGGFGDELFGGSGAKIVFDIGLEGWLVALEGEEVVGFVGDDLVCDLDLTAHGV